MWVAPALAHKYLFSMKHILVFYEVSDEKAKEMLESIKDNPEVKDYCYDEKVDKNGWSPLWNAYFHEL